MILIKKNHILLKGEEMKQEKLIAVLLFLLLLLLILCPWQHSSNIVENKALSLSNQSHIQEQVTTQQPIKFKLIKEKNEFELLGNFSNKESIERVHTALNINNLQDKSKIDSSLKENNEAILLTEQLIPLFYEKYISGSINYENEKLTVEGSVENTLYKDQVSTILANSTLSSVNNTKVIFVPKEPIYLKIDKRENKLTIDGVFNSGDTADKIVNAMGKEKFSQEIAINEELVSNPTTINFIEKLIHTLRADYLSGYIHFIDNKLSINGTVATQEAKANMEALLKNAGIPYKNNTKIVIAGPSKEELAAKKLAEEQATALIEAQKLAKKKETKLAEAKKIEAEIKQVIDLENINFELNKARLTEKSIDTVSHIASILNQHKKIHVEIGGHTDDTGADEYNLKLSQRRVDSVKKRLIEMEIDSTRLKAVGYGELKPLVSNDTEENRRLNRRVEFKVIGE